jgi:hypothetical protein
VVDRLKIDQYIEVGHANDSRKKAEREEKLTGSERIRWRWKAGFNVYQAGPDPVDPAGLDSRPAYQRACQAPGNVPPFSFQEVKEIIEKELSSR